ncbi:hypothetical protein [Cylindrospermopsis raciborskii]|uniref:Uncharacterized protein n=2 Tax=Cylindrospermopsis raciborskii TaxID=77022 RepID=A0A853MCA6_9CYAN|nr:hypothetical protein [Cylindrospermopsis raciborskii]EFA69577.1 hypothetical protein CRC_01858 [Cylindrospermopsis raciborskii CS-505]OBU74828.1 hypothetical protein A9P98_17865 [Cylindrospermopsis raciborskii CS-505]PNJ90632.1 hypothetical protein CEP14_19100 [Cylindrospermopsis raciborskii C04]PNJ92181.1 hypothetical protein CEP13_16145 [Cylindrospermopsis raciborskii C03]PNJ95738.1 hypothetical protein CEP15_11550 [Cylindrospermopsis raciborskii C07]
MLNFEDEAVGVFLQKLEAHGVKNFKMMQQHDNQWYAVYLMPFVNNREIKLNKKVLAPLEEVETEF